MKSFKNIWTPVMAVILLQSGLAAAHVKIPVASIPDDTPQLASNAPVMIVVNYYQFQLSDDHTRAGLYVDYNVQCYSDSPPIIDPTITEIPGLTYSASASEIIFDDNGSPVVCATVTPEQGVFGKHLKIKNTGLCRVTSTHTDHKSDDGWRKRRYRSLDVFFET